MPQRYQKNLAFETLMQKVQAAGTFTEDEQALLTWATGEQALKLGNRQKVIEYMVEVDPAIVDVVADRPALPPKEQDVVAEQSERYFWDRFWADAEVASVEYIQRLYGQIAARKARSKEAVSLRTLDILRCLEPQAAEIFAKLLPHVIDETWLPTTGDFKYDALGITYDDLLECDEVGLIDTKTLLLTIGGLQIERLHFKAVLAGRPFIERGQLSVIPLTRAGRDIGGLSKAATTPEQFRLLQNFVLKNARPQFWSDNANGPWRDVPDKTDNQADLFEQMMKCPLSDPQPRDTAETDD